MHAVARSHIAHHRAYARGSGPDPEVDFAGTSIAQALLVGWLYLPRLFTWSWAQLTVRERTIGVLCQLVTPAALLGCWFAGWTYCAVYLVALHLSAALTPLFAVHVLHDVHDKRHRARRVLPALAKWIFALNLHEDHHAHPDHGARQLIEAAHKRT